MTHQVKDSEIGRSPLRSVSGVLVVGGQQRSPAGMRELDDRWYGYGKGVILDLSKAGLNLARTYESQPGTHGPADPVLLKSASLVDGKIYGCSQTEVIVFSADSLEAEHHITNPLLNDVHHVVPGNTEPGRETLMVAVSGHDLVAELDYSGELVSMWSVDGSNRHESIDLSIDYRVDCDLKPHPFHPNYLFRHPDGSLWVTRFETKDAVEVGNPSRRIDVGQERCHDGVVHDGKIYFTTVDGHIVAADAETLAVVEKVELKGSLPNALLGWCRGLYFVDDVVVVGFSRIRHTKVRGALSWVRNGLSTSNPTRVAAYSTKTWDLVDEQDLEPAGCNAVFSILPGRG